ncbi:hypothetical protein [Consotaella aegiceratis]|uniref:hypothetical protein n=1 Tax=Consotaella aegiceratis TaxID=3097961 RepID=UPI002F3F10F3
MEQAKTALPDFEPVGKPLNQLGKSAIPTTTPDAPGYPRTHNRPSGQGGVSIDPAQKRLTQINVSGTYYNLFVDPDSRIHGFQKLPQFVLWLAFGYTLIGVLTLFVLAQRNSLRRMSYPSCQPRSRWQIAGLTLFWPTYWTYRLRRRRRVARHVRKPWSPTPAVRLDSVARRC